MSSESTSVYEVHLVEGIADVPATVTSDLVDFYDSGVWVRREDGVRDFFPYEHVAFIREQSDGGADEMSELDYQ